MTRLADYPRDTWFEAADTCPDCGARYELRLEAVDPDGEAGLVTIRAAHQAGCEAVAGLLVPTRTEDGRVWQEDKAEAGWEVGPRQVELQGQRYDTLTWHLDVLPCVSCARLLVGVPLLLFDPEGDWLLSFCGSCAKQFGLAASLRPTATEEDHA